MPNLPAQIGAGVTAFTSTDQVTRIELVMVQNLLNTTGKTLYVEQEKMIDASTAISGSGPAYVYFFMNAMMEAAQQSVYLGHRWRGADPQLRPSAVQLSHPPKPVRSDKGRPLGAPLFGVFLRGNWARSQEIDNVVTGARLYNRLTIPELKGKNHGKCHLRPR